jgi:hypothetical protein
MAETKLCEQCHIEKDIRLFRKVTNQYTGVHPMSICKDCYNSNNEVRKRRQAEEWEAREEARKQAEQERLVREEALEAWYLQQPDHQCVDCKQVLASSAFGYSIMREVDGVRIPASLHRRCRECHEVYYKQSQQTYPLCPMCNTPTRVGGFLREYHEYQLDLINVCCTNCIPHFEVLPETEQLELLRCALVKAYGETAVVYALQYDDHFPVQHIGRTKHYTRRMAKYRRDWHTEIKDHFILEELAFGPLSMERESRWMMHALKCRWPIDNFDLLSGEDGLAGKRIKARLTEAVKSFEPLTAPFEVVLPLLRENFMNTRDTHIVHWFVERYGIE